MTASSGQSSALLGLLRKETLSHPARSPDARSSSSLLPIVQVVLFGYAIRTDVQRRAPGDRGSRAGLRHAGAARPLQRADVFRIVAVVHTPTELDPLFQSGDAQEAVVFEPGFAAELGAATPAQLLIITDATEPNTGSSLQAYAHAGDSGYERELRGRATGRRSHRAAGAHPLQPDARKLEPVRARA